MTKMQKLIDDLYSGCNDGQGDLPSVMHGAARALEAGEKKAAALTAKLTRAKAKLAATNLMLDAVRAQPTPIAVEELVTESRRLEHDYGDGHEVKEHMLEVTAALIAAERALDELAARVADVYDDPNDVLRSVDDTLRGTGRKAAGDA